MAKISRHKIAAVIADKLDLSKDAKTLSREIAAYLMSTRRVGDLDSVMRDIMQIRADRGIVEVTAVTAYPLSAAVRRDIEKNIRTHFPTAKTIIVSERHDDEVVGGVRLELANQQLDLSVRAKLNRFKQLTMNNSGGVK